jgi:RecA-family ATPase
VSQENEVIKSNNSAQMNSEVTLKTRDNVLDDFDIDSETDYEKLMEMTVKMSDPTYLQTISMNELFDNVYQSRKHVIDGLLCSGTYIFAGAPKVGKSFFMAQLAYHVSTGLPLWDYPVKQGDVLYLALEDDYRRLQERLYRMFGTEGTEHLHFAISAQHLGRGLDEQLQRFVREHKETKLIIIDTLQKVRETSGERFSYASDYEIISRVKHFADCNRLCVILVHHTRKQPSDDRFDMISGTNGLLGAADGAYLLQKEKRTSNQAILDISGRDQQDQRLYLARDPERMVWLLERSETDLWKEPPDPLLDAVARFISESNTQWTGTATELVNKLELDMKPNVLTARLNISAGRLSDEYGIYYKSSRSHAGRRIVLKQVEKEL